MVLKFIYSTQNGMCIECKIFAQKLDIKNFTKGISIKEIGSAIQPARKFKSPKNQ